MFVGCTHTVKSADIPTLQTGSPLKGIGSKTFAFKDFQGMRTTLVFGQGVHKYVWDQPVTTVVAMLIRKELERNGHKCVAYSQQSNSDFILDGTVYKYSVGTRGLNSFACNVALKLTIIRASADKEVLAKSYQAEYNQAHRWGGHEPIDVSIQAMLLMVKEMSTDPEVIAFIEK
jgi:hypothetical protein